MDENIKKISEEERNKELFEHEKTELIIKLDGKLAEYNGSGLDVDLNQIESVNVNQKIDIPKTLIENASEKIDEIPQCGEINVEIDNIEIDPPNIDLPRILTQKSVNIPEVQLDGIEEKNFKLNIDTDFSIGNVTVDMDKIPEIKSNISVNRLDGVKIESANITMPQTNITIEKMKDIQAVKVGENIKIASKDISIGKMENVKEVKVGENIKIEQKNISFEKMSDVEIQNVGEKIEIKTANVDDPICQPDVSFGKLDIPETEIKEFPKIADNVYFERNTNIYGTQNINAAFEKTAFLSNALSNSTLAMKELNLENVKINYDDLNIDVRSKININNPKIVKVDFISDEIKQKMKDFTVEKPDFTKQIRAIMESIV